MRAGFAQKEITPELPVQLIGENRVAHTVHDPLAVHVGVFESEPDQPLLLLVSADLIAIDGLLLRLIQQKLATVSERRLRQAHLLLGAIHTHSAPGGTVNTTDADSILRGQDRIFGKTNPDYLEKVADAALQAMGTALDKLEPVCVRLKRFALEGIGTNRDDSALPADSRAFGLAFVGACEQNLLLHFSCHPTVLKGTEVSADLLWGIGAALPDFETIVFFNGDAGDISTRFTRTSTDFAQIERYQARFADAWIAVPWQDVSAPSFSIHSVTVEVPTRSVLPLPDLTRALADADRAAAEAHQVHPNSGILRLAESRAEGLRAAMQARGALSRHISVTMPISFLSFCGLRIITYPGELFSSLVREGGWETLPYFFCYTNGYTMYLADKAAHARGDYEAMASFFGEGTGEEVMGWMREQALLIDW